MTKRLLEFVEQLEGDELAEMSALVDARYRLWAGRVWEMVEKNEDLFLGNILSQLSRMINLAKLYALRLVNREWFLRLSQLNHVMRPNNYTYQYCKMIMLTYFTNIQSLVSDVTVLEATYFITPFQKIKKLEINIYSGRRRGLDITKWTSLTTLRVGISTGPILGLSTLTSLTSLECDSDSFAYEDQIFSLTNLSHLVVSGFSQHCPLSSLLPKLSHLESGCPRHFSQFTGHGKLQTDGQFHVYDFQGKAREFAQSHFDVYAKDSLMLDLEGEWKNGVFSGKAHIEFERLSLHGPMIHGKFHGLVTESPRDSYDTYIGMYENGQKHGKFIRCAYLQYSVDEKEEEWKNGVFIPSVIEKKF